MDYYYVVGIVAVYSDGFVEWKSSLMVEVIAWLEEGWTLNASAAKTPIAIIINNILHRIVILNWFGILPWVAVAITLIFIVESLAEHMELDV